MTGVYQTPQGYYVDDAEVDEFDKGFPPKSKESQAAYKALGCVRAEEVIPWIADEEPFDVQLEYLL